MKKILALGTLFLVLTMSAFASSQPVKHKITHHTEQAARLSYYTVMGPYCHAGGLSPSSWGCCYYTVYFYLISGVPFITSTVENCDSWRGGTLPPDHSASEPDNLKNGSGTSDDYIKWYLATYPGEAVLLGDDGGPRK